MKLKYKLFFSYLILIIFISIALFLLILQLKSIDHFVRSHIEQDVQEVVDLSHQQQILEDVYAQYLLVRLPGDSKQKYQLNLEISIEEYTQNWQQYKSRSNTVSKISFFPIIDFLIYKTVMDTMTAANDRLEKKSLENECEQHWEKAGELLSNFASDPDHSIPDLKIPITNLREKLIRLSELIGQQAIRSGIKMRQMAESMNLIVLIIILSMIVVSLLIAFLVARIFSRPLEELKTGVEQIAIQNFDVKIRHKPNDEIGDLASAFEQMAHRLKQNEKFKTEMLGQFTHEMKSPLVAINQALDLLQHSIGSQITKNQKRLLAILFGNSETLANLITNILHSATYDADNMQLDLKCENIIKVFTNTIMKLAPTVKDKNIQVNLNFSSEKVDCDLDKERMEEVFYNLVSNAIKFSPVDSTLQVTILERDSLIYFKLKDEGIGIPPQEIPYIFEKMYRASNSAKISVKGTGLGLYITSQIIQAHGGNIKVRSKENEGSEFTISLPKRQNRAEDSETSNVKNSH
jgi:signal transduction histidine kinase